MKKDNLEDICEYAVKDFWNKKKKNCKLVGYTKYACIKDDYELCDLYIKEKEKEKEYE